MDDRDRPEVKQPGVLEYVFHGRRGYRHLSRRAALLRADLRASTVWWACSLAACHGYEGQIRKLRGDAYQEKYIDKSESVAPIGQPRLRRGSSTVVACGRSRSSVALAAVLIDQAMRPANTFQGHPMHDVLGLFSVTVPDGWTVVGGIDTTQSELDVDPMTGKLIPTTVEGYQFYNQQPGNMSAFVRILIEELNTSAARTQYCHPIQYANATVDGLQARSDGPGGPIIFHSGNAFFEVWVSVTVKPVYQGFSHTLLPTPTVTDPVQTAAQAQSIVNSIKVTNRGSCKAS